MNLELAGRAVVVTGGSRGIGRAIVTALLAEDARVVLAARGAAGVEEAVASTDAPDRVLGVVCDVGTPGGVQRLVDAARERFGAVDGVVANATANALGCSEADYAASVAVDLMQAVRLTEAVRAAQPARPLAVVALSSIDGKRGSSPFQAYSVAKAALLAWVKNAALDLAGAGVRVNAVVPGAIFCPGGYWDEVRRGDPEEFDRVLAAIPGGRMGRPEEVADAVLFLLSARASWITGAALLVDGGEYVGIA